jgi:hypothetical protein
VSLVIARLEAERILADIPQPYTNHYRGLLPASTDKVGTRRRKCSS